MPSTVFVTGASGFVGSAILDELTKRGFNVIALINRGKIANPAPQIKSTQADLFDPSALAAAMSGASAVIHLVGIIMENPKAGVTFQRMHADATRTVVDAAQRAGIKRFIHMSALGTRPDAVSDYHKTKWLGEQSVRQSPLDWTILCPSMIHGPRGEFMRMEARWARKQSPPFLFMPYFGKGFLGSAGAGRIQPIFVNDVARAFVNAIDNSKSIRQSYALAGAEQLTWPQMHEQIARAILNKSRLTMPIPAWYAKTVAAIAPRSLLPFNRDQVIMSQEDNTADTSEFQRDFGWQPQGFADALAQYASSL